MDKGRPESVGFDEIIIITWRRDWEWNNAMQ